MSGSIRDFIWGMGISLYVNVYVQFQQHSHGVTIPSNSLLLTIDELHLVRKKNPPSHDNQKQPGDVSG